MSNTDDDLLIGTITIHRYLTADGSEDYITTSATDNSGEELNAIEKLGMLELARLHFTTEYLGYDEEDVDE